METSERTSLQRWLDEGGYSQGELADALHMSRTRIGEIARGSTPGSKFLLKFGILIGHDKVAQMFPQEATDDAR
jgi:transcriptional regulator with XRE-family HTH domain